MAYPDTVQQFISLKGITSQRLHGLILGILMEVGYDPETFYPAQNLLEHIAHDSCDSITLELERRKHGWTVYNFRAHRFTAGAPTIRLPSDS